MVGVAVVCWCGGGGWGDGWVVEGYGLAGEGGAGWWLVLRREGDGKEGGGLPKAGEGGEGETDGELHFGWCVVGCLVPCRRYRERYVQERVYV